MHFWIDKRSQCAYTGRHRVPSSLSAGVGRPRGRVGVVGARKGMAAPVHRFAALDPPPRRPRPHRNHNPTIPTRRPVDEPSLYVEIPPSPAAPPAPTIAHIAAARSVTPDTLLRTAALGLHHSSPVMAPHLKFGMLVSAALATVFLAGAKYYFDRQVMREPGRGGNAGGAAGAEASVVCAALAALAVVGCALSLCRARTAPPPIPPDRISSTARRRTPPPSTSSLEPSDDISLGALLQPPPARGAVGGAVEAPPPPYHIAVLLPPRRDQSPPAYHALS